MVSVTCDAVDPVPLPVSVAVSGAAALLLTVSEPVRVPVVVGVNDRTIVQLVFAARELPQVVALVLAKSPVTVMAEMVRVTVLVFVSVRPGLVTVALTAADPNEADCAESVAVGVTIDAVVGWGRRSREVCIARIGRRQGIRARGKRCDIQRGDAVVQRRGAQVRLAVEERDALAFRAQRSGVIRCKCRRQHHLCARCR